MIPVDFPEKNATFTAPKGMADCLPLPAYRGDQQIVSCWKLSWRERWSALVHGRVWLQVQGEHQVPVNLSATKRIFE